MAAPTLSQNDWVTQLATAYRKDPSLLGAFGNQQSNYDNANAQHQFETQISGNQGLMDLWRQGAGVDQITGAPSAHLADYVQKLQSGAYGDNVPPEVQKLIDSGAIVHHDESTGNEGWAAPGAELPTGEAAYTPFNASLYRNPNLVGIDLQHGVVTTTANATSKLNQFSDMLLPALMSGMWGGMMTAGLTGAGGASSLLKAPSVIGRISDMLGAGTASASPAPSASPASTITPSVISQIISLLEGNKGTKGP